MAIKRSKSAEVIPPPTPEPETQVAPASDAGVSAAQASQDANDMACAGCGNTPPADAPAPLAPEQITTPERPSAEAVLLKFTGPYSAPVTFFEFYTGCKTCPPVWADPATAERLMNTGMWQRAEEQPA